jgi:glycosyltransferase involved in cell wall biosynthesis
MKNGILNNLFHRAKNKIKNYVYYYFGYPYIINWKKDCGNLKRALFVYQVDPFYMEDNDEAFYFHNTQKQAIQIAEILTSKGFIIDIFDYRDKRIKLQCKYDLIISHNPNLIIHQSNLKHTTKIIYFAAGENPIIANEKVRKCYLDFFKRNGTKLKIKRLAPEGDSFIKQSKYIVLYGNENTAATFYKYYPKMMFCFNNYGYNNTRFEANHNNYEERKRNFLFFSGGDMVAKGLDLLLETFLNRDDVQLYICAPYRNEKDFMRFYQRKINKRNNIHFCGFIRPLSEQYYNIVNKCGFIIHPSATEGQPGGVIQAMHSGLVPIISKYCGIDSGASMIVLKSCEIKEIDEIINDCIKKGNDWLMEASLSNHKLAIKQYSEDAFNWNWNKILDTILAT